jgi:magnesium-transporting ATPase (P-type)
MTLPRDSIDLGGEVLASDYPFLDILWTMFIFFLFVIWIWILITVFADIFRSHDLSGWAKALWVIFVIVLPYLGVFVYLIAEGKAIGERSMKQAQEKFGVSYVAIRNWLEDSGQDRPVRAKKGEGKTKAEQKADDGRFDKARKLIDKIQSAEAELRGLYTDLSSLLKP